MSYNTEKHTKQNQRRVTVTSTSSQPLIEVRVGGGAESTHPTTGGYFHLSRDTDSARFLLIFMICCTVKACYSRFHNIYTYKKIKINAYVKKIFR